MVCFEPELQKLLVTTSLNSYIFLSYEVGRDKFYNRYHRDGDNMFAQ